MNTNIIPGSINGNHVADGPLTTSAIREASPELLRNEIDSRVVKIRPMSTPVDQISRMVGARPAQSMIVDYYSVDTRPIESTVKDGPDLIDGIDSTVWPMTFKVTTANDRLFAPTETVMFPGISVTTDQGKTENLVCYVSEVMTGKNAGLKLVALNLSKDFAAEGIPPEMSKNEPIVRMGRAAAELDVQTAQFEALPVKASNYCQIFKAQIEQSAFARLSAKEVGWSFSDQEEVAIMDMRLGMEKSFLFGTKMRLTDPLKFDEVLFTDGIWNQAGSEHTLELGDLDQSMLLSMMKHAFTGEASGSSRKVLLAGSDLVLALNNLETTKVLMAGDVVTRWGIDFNEIRSKFGSLYVVHSEVFDQCGHSSHGLILDVEYMTKYSHVPFRVERLDLKSSGQRNTEALVATEASCIVLRHPKTHVRIIGQ